MKVWRSGIGIGEMESGITWRVIDLRIRITQEKQIHLEW